MASPMAIRHPLTPQIINTTTPTSTTFHGASTAHQSLAQISYKQLPSTAGQKRLHSQINHVTGKENTNPQTQILEGITTFKQPPRPILTTTTAQHFKQPLPRPSAKTTAVSTTRQRQQTHDPEEEDGDQSRQNMKRRIPQSTFYFDVGDDTFQQQATKWLQKQGAKVEQFFSISVNYIITDRDITAVYPKTDILSRARDLSIKLWTCDKFKRVILGYTMNSPSRTVNPQHLSAALKLEKRHGRTLETDPTVARDEYVYFQGPYILISDIAGVHKPIMVKEFPPNSGREQALWPFIWATKEGSCPFVRPKQNIAPNVEKKELVQIMSRKIPRPIIEVERKRVTLKEIGHVTNRVPAGMAMGMGITDQPASGIVNSSNQYSAIRSATTGSNITSVTGGVNGTLTLGTSRPVRDLKTRSVAVTTRMEPPPAKKRKTETSLREQVVKAKKEKKEGYCENCKEKFDDYGEHTESRRHRKYARNAKNFVELDRLLEQLRRPLLTDRD